MVFKSSLKSYINKIFTIIFGALFFFYTCCCLINVSAATVYPTESNAVLKNPNKGFMLTGNATTKRITDPNRYSQGVWDSASVGYLRCDWSTLEPNEGVYQWSVVDDALNVCTAKGLKLALGVMPACINNSTSYAQSTPLWVFSAGAAYTTEVNGAVKIPVWNDPVYKNKLQNFIMALKNRYDTNDNIAFFDIRNYGNYGEWHLGNLPNSVALSEADKKSHVDMWSGFAKNLMLIDNYIPLDNVGIYGRDIYKTGIRRDGCVSPDYATGHMTLMDAYDKTPAAAEWYGQYSEYKAANKWRPVMFERTLREGKPSYMGLSIWDETTFYNEQAPLINKWVNRVGYWLKVVKGTYPDNLGNGTQGTFNFQVKNDGVAPIYPNKNNLGYVKLALMDNNNTILSRYTLTGINPYNWKPATYTNESASFQFPYNANGTKLAIGVFTSDSLSNPDVKLGVNGTTVDNWYILNSMPAVESNELSANKLYSASAEYECDPIGYREAQCAFDNDPNTSWVADNLLVNSSFEYPVLNSLYNNTNWKNYNACSLTTVTTPVNTGVYAAKISGRANSTTGIKKDIKSVLLANGQGNYRFEAMLRATSGNPSMSVAVKINDSTGDHYFNTAGTINTTGWTRVYNTKNITWSGTLNSAMFYIESADGNTQDFYADDCALTNMGGHWLEVDFGESKTFTKAYIQEKNARTSGYKIQYYDGTNWADAYTGSTIGTAGVNISFAAKTGSKARLLITGITGWPDISEFKVLK